MVVELTQRLKLEFRPETHRRRILGHDVIIHCHHYNARIQRTIEGAAGVDGRAIFVASAEAVFAEMLQAAVRPSDDGFAVSAAVFAHLGYGRLHFEDYDQGVVTASESHFVEGWAAGFPQHGRPVCSLAAGFVQAAASAVRGDLVDVTEVACRLQGAPCCRFEVTHGRVRPLERVPRRLVVDRAVVPVAVRSPNVDEKAILEALVAMPVHGDDDGLIPAFNVYLANTPADFYNLVSVRFLEEMARIGLGMAARRQLVHDAETCAMNTFRGIMTSPEWDGLVGPMLKAVDDPLFGIVAVSNALGWGNWYVAELSSGISLRLECANGYESEGALFLTGPSREPQCLMLTGVAAGIMALVYGDGSIQERFGQFTSAETSCRCCAATVCTFVVEEAR